MDELLSLLKRCVPALVCMCLGALALFAVASVATRVLPELANALSVFVLSPGGLVAAALLFLWLRKK